MIEDLIYSVLTDEKEQSSISDMLARYKNKPAVFMQSAPSDMSGELYPRIDYVFDRASNDERKTEGLLTINVWCKSTGVLPEEIEANIRQLFSNIFIKDSGETYCFSWDRNDYFEIKGDTKSENTLVLGVSLFFDVLAFPLGKVSEPDPIAAIMDYTNRNYEDIQLIGNDNMDCIFKANDDTPAVYYNISKLERAESWALCQWMNVRIQAHIFAGSAEKRTEIVKIISDNIARDECIRMRDGSDMRCIGLNVNMDANIAKIGQITFIFHYGILRKNNPAEKLNNIGITEKWKESRCL